MSVLEARKRYRREETPDDDRLYTPELVAALCAGSAFGFATSVFYLLPKFLTELGADSTQIGAATTVFGLATVAATPLLALWIDSVDRVRMLRAGAVLMLLSSLAFVRVDAFDGLFIGLRAVQGCAFALFFTALTAIVTDIAPARRLSEALGAAGASMLTMNAVAPAIAEPLAASHGWDAAFLSAAVASLATLAILTMVRGRAPTSKGPDFAGLGSVLVQARTVHYVLVTAAVGAAFGVMFTFPQPYALELGAVSVRGFFIAYSTFALGARLVFGRASDRLGRHRVAVFALNLYTLVVLSAAGLTPGLLEPIGALLGVAHGLFFPAFNAIVLVGARPCERGKLATVFTGAFYGGLALGALPFGWIAEAAGYPAVFVGAAAMTFAAGGLLVFSRPLSAEGGRSLGLAAAPHAAFLPSSGDKEER